MKKLFFVIIFIVFSNLFGANNNLDKLLTPQDISVIENSILKEAIKYNNYNDITTIALSFLASSKNSAYMGNKTRLYNRSIELLLDASKNGNINSSMFLIMNFLNTKPLLSRDIAKKIILLNADNPKDEFLKVSKSLITTFAALTLDHFSTNIKEVNLAIESLVSLNLDTPQINLYLGFLFSSLDSDEIADTYLNKACNNAKEKQIVSFCSSKQL